MLRTSGQDGLAEAVDLWPSVPDMHSPSVISETLLDLSVQCHKQVGIEKYWNSPRNTLKLELPMIINGSVFSSRADSGSEENIMAMDLAKQLGIHVDTSPQHRQDFRLGNGKVVKALGRVKIGCAFARDAGLWHICLFYVFRVLITPVIMGMAFLEETETLSKNRHRFCHRPHIPRGVFQLCSLDNPRRRLVCLADGHLTMANADTGSDINLISLNFAKQRRFTMTALHRGWDKIQFADGEVSHLEGRVTLSIALTRSSSPRVDIDFYVLKGLTCDMLLGEDFLNKADAFSTYGDAFTVTDGHDIAELNIITWHEGTNRFLPRFGSRNEPPTLSPVRASSAGLSKRLGMRNSLLALWYCSNLIRGISDRSNIMPKTAQ